MNSEGWTEGGHPSGCSNVGGCLMGARKLTVPGLKRFCCPWQWLLEFLCLCPVGVVYVSVYMSIDDANVIHQLIAEKLWLRDGCCVSFYAFTLFVRERLSCTT